ncbi:hypothetical protein M422DRAFT_782084 [Sphaerobolus stellatus SS14]|uniref:Uncharacterized protein n=1 Tax=Sphaerobolus stellatus (strain SS14) TaxID=990650 RepID=A0A0C9VGI7_SPHS4|nr:hypothetical protein M422DRAFT_782084 [Sphaerobolus stellatus SS14]
MNAPSDYLRREGIRSRIVEIILGHTMTIEIRKAAYIACAIKGYQAWFNKIRYTEGGDQPYSAAVKYSLGSETQAQAEAGAFVKVVPETKGFRLEWTVPMFLARMRYMSSVGTEFVAQGHIWNIAISQTKWLGEWSVYIYNLSHLTTPTSLGGLRGILTFANAPPNTGNNKHLSKERNVHEETIDFKVIECLLIPENSKSLHVRWKENPTKLLGKNLTGGGAFPLKFDNSPYISKDDTCYITLKAEMV